MMHPHSKPPDFQAGWMLQVFLAALILIFLHCQKAVVSCPYMKLSVAQPQKRETALLNAVQAAAMATDTASQFLLSIGHGGSSACLFLPSAACQLPGAKENSMFRFLSALIKHPYCSYRGSHSKGEKRTALKSQEGGRYSCLGILRSPLPAL